MFMKELHYWGIEDDNNNQKEWLENYLEKCNNSIKKKSFVKEDLKLNLPSKDKQPQNQDIGYSMPNTMRLEHSLYTDFDLRYLDDPKAKDTIIQ